MPQASTRSASSRQWFSKRGRHSPKPPRKTCHGRAALHAALEPRAEPGDGVRMPPLAEDGPALEAVAAQEAGLARVEVAETRDVDAVGPVAARVGDAPEHGQRAAGAAAHHVVHQVVAEHAAGVGDAVRVPARRGVQHDARGLQRRGAQDDDLAGRLALAARQPVHVADAGALPFRVGRDVADDGVRNERQPPRGGRRRQRAVRAAVVRAGPAAAPAGAAVVAGRAAVQRARQHRRAADGQRAPEAVRHRLLEDLLAAGERHRRQELAVGELRQPPPAGR